MSKSIQTKGKRLLPSKNISPLGEPWVPAPYQKKAVKFLLEHACAGLWLDPGLRKTSIVLGAVKILKKEGLLCRVLVIAPLRVCYSVWPAEVKKWADFSHLRVEILHGPGKEKALERDADIYVINPEGLDWLFGVSKARVEGRKRRVITYDLSRFEQLNADTLVIDEASKFKSSSSERFQVIKPILPKFDRRWGLTGSPCSNGLLDLFGVMYVVDLGRALGQFITHYRAAYFMPSGYGGFTWVPQHGAEERIYDRLKPSVFRLEAGDYVKLPELVENVIKVNIPATARKIYDELENDFLSDIDGELVTAANAGVAGMKCRQVANGGLYLARIVDSDGVAASGPREWKDLHDEKIYAVRELVDELNGAPVIVVYDFGHDLARLLKEFGANTPVIGGGVSAKKSDALIKAWNRGEVPVLLGHPAAMGHGLNAQEGNAQHIIFHSLTWDLELYDQLVRRLVRSGNKSSHVFIHHIVAQDTVDEAVMLALRKKRRTQGAVLDALREYSKDRKASFRRSIKSALK